MHELDDFAGGLDVAVAVNSIVMPDVREIDRTLSAIRASLRPGGEFLGILPAMDAIHYHTMLLCDEALDRGLAPEEAERHAAFQGEHHFYEFAFGRFGFQGLRQKFWQPFEIHHRFAKAGFAGVDLEKVLYPWDDTITGGPAFADLPPELGLVVPGPGRRLRAAPSLPLPVPHGMPHGPRSPPPADPGTVDPGEEEPALRQGRAAVDRRPAPANPCRTASARRPPRPSRRW